MHNVLRTSDATPELNARLGGLMAKLLALRADIDATLAELDSRAQWRPGAADELPDTLVSRLAEVDPSGVPGAPGSAGVEDQAAPAAASPQPELVDGGNVEATAAAETFAPFEPIA